MADLCRLADVHFSYGSERVLRGVDLGITRKAVWGMVGDNGSGKSTILKILAGILRPDSGCLYAPGGRPRIGYMPENCMWYPDQTGAQILRYFSKYSGADACEQKVLLKRVGLWPARDKKVGGYSKGMRQKLGMAQAISGNPNLLILDEPTNGLDPRSICDFYEILSESVALGMTVILSSHLLSELDGRITHVAHLSKGRISWNGSCDQLLQRFRLPIRVVFTGINFNLLKEAVNGRWELRERVGKIEVLVNETEVAQLLILLTSRGMDLGRFEVLNPGIEDLYLNNVTDGLVSNDDLRVEVTNETESYQ